MVTLENPNFFFFVPHISIATLQSFRNKTSDNTEMKSLNNMQYPLYSSTICDN